MAMIDLDEEVNNQLKEIYDKEDKLEFPNYRNFVNRILKSWINNREKKEGDRYG